MIDLHTHSTFSDGSLSPAQLVERAVRLGLTGLSLTDHDCTAGIPDFLEAAGAASIAGVSGVEISVDVSKGTFHLLGYLFNHEDSSFQEALAGIRNGRERRNGQMLARINSMGMGMTWPEVSKAAGEGVVGRPHFAQVMVDRGYVSSRKEAFAKYLAKGKPGYVDRARLSPESGIWAIRAAGGVAVLAHPGTLELCGSRLWEYVRELKEIGLQGVEVYYSEHSEEQVSAYNDMAKSLDLVATGGSDFHGDLNPRIELGRGFGGLSVPDGAVDELRGAQRV